MAGQVVEVTSASGSGHAVDVSFADGSTYGVFSTQDNWTGTLGSEYTWSAANLPYVNVYDAATTRTINWGGEADGTHNQFSLYKNGVIIAVGTHVTYNTVTGTVLGAPNFKLESGSFDVELVPNGIAGIEAGIPPHSHLHIGLNLVDGLYDEGDPTPVLQGSGGMTVSTAERTGLAISGWETDENTHGTVDWNSDHTKLIYTPTHNYFGYATFRYTIQYAGEAIGHDATVRIYVDANLQFNLTTDSNNDGGISSEDDLVEDADPGMFLTITESDTGDYADIQPILLTVASPELTEIEYACSAQIKLTGSGTQSFRMWRDADRSTSLQSDGIITLSRMFDGTYGAVVWVEAIAAGDAVIEAELLDNNGLVFAQAKRDRVRVRGRQENVIAKRGARKAVKENGETVSYGEADDKSIELFETYEIPYSKFVGIANPTTRNNAIRDDIMSKIGFSNSPDYIEALIWHDGTFGPNADVISSNSETTNGTSGWLLYIRYNADSAKWMNDGTGRLDFSGLTVRVMPYLVVFNLEPSDRQYVIVGPPIGGGDTPTFVTQGPANTLEHERWHTNGVPLGTISAIETGLENAAGSEGNSPRLQVRTPRYFDISWYNGPNGQELFIRKEIPLSNNGPPTMFLLNKRGYYNAASDVLEALIINLRRAKEFPRDANPTAEQRKAHLESLLSNWLAHDARKGVVQKVDEPAIYQNGAVSIINWSGTWHTNSLAIGYNKPTFYWNNTLVGEQGDFTTLGSAISATDP